MSLAVGPRRPGRAITAAMWNAGLNELAQAHTAAVEHWSVTMWQL